jgi:DNA helicase-2/ATP-dependent DNA helicase PcrA
MPLNNRILLASAGSGKSSAVVREACDCPQIRLALITYTTNNVSELRLKTYETTGVIPPHIVISSWYAFLLRHFVRPYQRCLHLPRISRIYFTAGPSAQYSKETNVLKHYFVAPGKIYGDKVSKFSCEIIKQTQGLPLRRLEQIFDRIYVDECQDLAGYDLELLESLMKSRVSLVLAGDHRQATYSTNPSPKNKKFSRE